MRCGRKEREREKSDKISKYRTGKLTNLRQNMKMLRLVHPALGGTIKIGGSPLEKLMLIHTATVSSRLPTAVQQSKDAMYHKLELFSTRKT